MYLNLTRLRLHWYTITTARLLMRHWQAVVVTVLLLPSSVPLPVLLRGAALPLTALFAAGHGLLWHLAYLAQLQTVTLGWAMLQRGPIGGNDFRCYTAALPISTTVRRWADLSILLLANSVLLLPMAIAMALLLVSTGHSQPIFQIICLLILLILVLVTQLAALEKNTAALPGILLAVLLLGISLTFPDSSLAWLLLPLVPFSAMAFLMPRRTGKIRRISMPFTAMAQLDRRHRQRLGIPPSLHIQLKTLFIDSPSSTILRISLAFGVALIVNLLIRIFEFDYRSLPAAIIAMAIIAMIISGIYRTLHAAHTPMQSYLAALPLGFYYWAIRDTFFVALLGTVPLAALLLPFLNHGGSSTFTIAALVVAYLLLLGLLRLPLLFGGRQAVLLSLILAASWSAAAMAAI